MGDSDEPAAPSPRRPVALAGSATDAKLRVATALSREEVIRRRRRRLLQLYSLYHAQFWALVEQLAAKHGKYWWEHGTSPVIEAHPPACALPLLVSCNGGAAVSVAHGSAGVTGTFPASNCAPPPPSENGKGSVVTASGPGGRAACSAANCVAKAMPFAPYCYDHILLDRKQQLYRPCAFVTKRSSTPNGEEICGKPVLRGITPLLCSDHDPKAQKHIIETLKNVGIDLPLTTKSVPKLSILISETIRQIQKKRKLCCCKDCTIIDH